MNLIRKGIIALFAGCLILGGCQTQENPQETSEPTTIPEELTSEELRNLANSQFGLVEPYQYFGIAYYLDEENRLRDSYIPFGAETDFQLGSTYSKNHGVSIKVYMTREYTDAKDALNHLSAGAIATDNKEITDMKLTEGGNTFDNDTVGFRYMNIYGKDEEGNEVGYSHISYADIRDEGYYMIAIITLYGPEFDEDTPIMMEELQDIYGLALPGTLEDILNFVRPQ